MTLPRQDTGPPLSPGALMPRAAVAASEAQTDRPRTPTTAEATAEATAFGRAVSATADSRQTSDDKDDKAPVHQLPAELLRLLFDWLPLSCHSSCALVCRRWYSCLPDTRLQIAGYQTGHNATYPWLQSAFAAGYSARTGPWLAGCGSRWAARLDCQQRELSRQQACHPDQRPASLPVFYGLIRYALDRQLTETCHQALLPAPCSDDSPVRASDIAFSPCGRWLFVRQDIHAPQARRGLVLYGWQQDRWQLQRLTPRVAVPVNSVLFCTRAADSLFCSYAGGRLIRWSRDAETGVWQAVELAAVGGDYRCRIKMTDAADNLIVQFQRRNAQLRREARLAIMPWPQNADSRWHLCQDYRRVTFDMILEPVSGQLAMALRLPAIQGGGGAIQIWQVPHDCRAGLGVETTTLFETRVHRLAYGRCGSLLLGVLEDGQLRLWQPCAQGHLQELWRLDPPPAPLGRWVTDQALLWRDSTLTVARSLHQIQFWNRDDSGHWCLTGSLEIPPDPARSDDRLRYILLASDGRTLVRVSRWQVDLWHQGPCGWERLVQRVSPDADRIRPRARLLAHDGLQCVINMGQELMLYGRDSHGQLRMKARMMTPSPVRFLKVSKDGLSLVIGKDPVRLIQLGTSPEAEPPVSDLAVRLGGVLIRPAIPAPPDSRPDPGAGHLLPDGQRH